ncbi:MAG: fasciclin domain-containing protein [Maribacter sp.]|nr:fasciclin domain-containing protein [Maribacter sp.]NNK19154.1 fasciclin domain-containing protein [Maribacter sp.]
MKMIKTLTVLAIVGIMTSAQAQNEIAMNNIEKSDKALSITSKGIVVSNTIVDVAASNDNFTTLVAAVKAADLVSTLQSEGPFTVFAPTNDAFAKLPEGTVAGLLKPESKDVLTSILTYHVVSGKFEAAAVIDAVTKNGGKFMVTTVQGGTITISVNDGKVMLTDEKGNMSTVIMADVGASNGVIHAIDAVVMPK